MVTTYEPGDLVPPAGNAEYSQCPGTHNQVTGTRFAPYDHWPHHHPEGPNLVMHPSDGGWL